MRRAVVLVLLLACSKDKPTSAAPDTAPSASTSAAVADAGKPPSTESNLLYTTDAIVTVSSKVDNPKDFPEHLVDGKPETAWNGKTGDLVGGFIEIDIPRAAHVSGIEMSCGFDKKSANGDDLFTMNHRISKIRISRDGKQLKEATLDTNQRKPQPIKLDAEGGHFRIEVLETLPGTKKEWKELVVSELVVWGDAKSAGRSWAHLPDVVVGAEPPKPRPAVAKPTNGEALQNITTVKSLDAYCKDHIKTITPVMKAEEDRYPGPIDPPFCSIGSVDTPAQPPATKIQSVSITEVDDRRTYLAVTTPKGVIITPALLSMTDFRNPGCGGNCVLKEAGTTFQMTKKGTAMVTKVDSHCWSTPLSGASDFEGFPGASTYTEIGYVCFFTDDGDVSCKRWVDTKEAQTSFLAYEDDFARVKWTTTKKLALKPDGDLLFE